jgi:hypothetical protein
VGIFGQLTAGRDDSNEWRDDVERGTWFFPGRRFAVAVMLYGFPHDGGF